MPKPLPIPRRLIPLLIVLSAQSAFAAGLNDTGINFCADDTVKTANCTTVAGTTGTHPRQDAVNGRDAQAAAGTLAKIGGGGKGFDFTKIANNGSTLPASAALGAGSNDWACTKDNVTGLVWEVKTTSGLRSQSHTYGWKDSNPATNGGVVGGTAGTCFEAGRCDTESYVIDVVTAGLCGATNWRMPTIKELDSIVDLGRASPTIDPDYFPNTVGGYYWSGSPVAYTQSGTSFVWYLEFSRGSIANNTSRNNGYGAMVRLVRSAP